MTRQRQKSFGDPGGLGHLGGNDGEGIRSSTRGYTGRHASKQDDWRGAEDRGDPILCKLIQECWISYKEWLATGFEFFFGGWAADMLW